ncbi:hypothetical protein ACET3Z_030033 [Daucus carota]
MKLEVVPVYIYDSWNNTWRTNEESLMEEFGTMPRLALPFRDANCKKVQRVIGSFGEYFEPFGSSDVFICKLSLENIKKVNLGILLDPEPVFIRGCGSEVPYSDIVCKRVILLCDAVHSELDIRFKIKLQEEYQKKICDEFEVIHIGSRKGEEVSWSTLHPNYPYKHSTVIKILHDIFHYGYGSWFFIMMGRL